MVVEFVGDGVQHLVHRALRAATGSEMTPDQVRTGVNIFLEEYAEHLLDSTRLYPGVRETLDRMEWADFGVVTNKPEELSRRIIEGLDLARRFCTILGGDSAPVRKPDPAPLFQAMMMCRAAADDTVMVGDSPGDVRAGRAAGVLTCGISAGFHGRAALEEAGCDLIIESFSELPAHFRPPGMSDE